MVHARRALRTQEILDAARALVAEEGLEGLTVHRLAKGMGYAAGALYRYFPSKEALLVELQCQALGELTERIIERLAVRRGGPLGPLVAAASVYERFSVEQADAFKLIAFAVGDPRVLVGNEAADKVLGAALPLFSAVAERFEEAAKAGALSEGSAMDRAVLFWSSAHGVLQLRKLARVQPLLEPRRLLPQVVEGLLLGWGARPKALAAARRAQEV